MIPKLPGMQSTLRHSVSITFDFGFTLGGHSQSFSYNICFRCKSCTSSDEWKLFLSLFSPFCKVSGCTFGCIVLILSVYLVSRWSYALKLSSVMLACQASSTCFLLRSSGGGAAELESLVLVDYVPDATQRNESGSWMTTDSLIDE